MSGAGNDDSALRDHLTSLIEDVAELAKDEATRERLEHGLTLCRDLADLQRQELAHANALLQEAWLAMANAGRAN